MQLYHSSFADNIKRSDADRIRDGLIEAIVGDYLGSGEYRDVYAHATDPKLVVKIETHRLHRHSANWREHDNWQSAEHADTVFEMDGQEQRASPWLAPVRWISGCGRVLLQDKGDRVAEDPDIPDKIPSFLIDIKPGNFVMLNGKAVAADYADIFIGRNHVCNWDGGMKKFHKKSLTPQKQ